MSTNHEKAKRSEDKVLKHSAKLAKEKMSKAAPKPVRKPVPASNS